MHLLIIGAGSASLCQPFISEVGGIMKTKIIVYKNKKGKEYQGIYVNEDHKGYFVLPEGKTRKKHIKWHQVIDVKEE